MANLEWPGDILIVSGVATVAFILLGYWYSGLMSKNNWSLQVKSRPKKRPAKKEPTEKDD